MANLEEQNDLLWKGKWMIPKTLVDLGESFLVSWLVVQKPRSSVSLTDVHGADKWKKPPPGFIKCNVDAGTFTSSSSIGSGATIRTHEGHFLVAKSCLQQSSILQPAFAEAYGIREVLSWIKGLGLQLVIVNAIQHASTSGSLIGMIVADCVQLISKIPYCKISFVRRSSELGNSFYS